MSRLSSSLRWLLVPLAAAAALELPACGGIVEGFAPGEGGAPGTGSAPGTGPISYPGSGGYPGTGGFPGAGGIPGTGGYMNPGGPAMFCGNGVLDPGEECDGANLGGQTCASVTMASRPLGMLRCTAYCMFDTSTCTSGVVPPPIGAGGYFGAGGGVGAGAFNGAGGTVVGAGGSLGAGG